MPAHDLALLENTVREAGQIACTFAKGTNKVWSKANDSPVTEADLAVNTYLEEHLRSARPDYGWLSEESEDDTARLAASRVFVVDPIDGTRAFVAGEETWAHSIAVVENGAPIAAVVYLPMKNELYAARQGAGATRNGTRIRAKIRDKIEGAEILASRPAFDPKHWRGSTPDIKRVFRPSIAYRICLVAEGRYDGMLTVRDSWEWDVAAGALIASEAGATVTDMKANKLTFNNAHPAAQGVLVAAEPLHQNLAGQLLSEPARSP